MTRLRWKLRARRTREPGPVGTFLGRIVATLFFGAFFGLGSVFVVFIAREAWRGAEPYGWPERRCEITRSEVVRESGEEPYVPVVAFHTTDGGRPARGQTIQRRPLSYDSHGEAAARLEAYPVQAVVPCRVAASGEAVLEAGPVWLALWILLPLIFVAIGGIGLVATWWPERKDRQGRPLPEVLGDKAAHGPGRGMVIAGLLVAAAGGLLTWFFGVVPLWQVQDARGWTPYACVVEHSSVVSQQSDDGTTYRVDILYSWNRGRGEERSSRYSFWSGASSGYAGKAEIVRRYPEGEEVDCWVHPERRDEGVLEPGFTTHALFALVPLAVFLGGIALAVAGRRKLAGRDRMRSRARLGQAPFPADDPVYDTLPAFERGGPVRLAAQSSRWGRVAGITFAALFWNGIVSVFVFHAHESFERGRPEWFLVVFLVPFVLVGVALVVGIFHALLGLRNARPVVTASTRAPTLGERLEVQWHFEGRTDAIAKMRLELVGREEATYRVGTDSRTARETFHEEVVVELRGAACGAGGHASIAIPDDGMHSFQSRHNKVIWELVLVGEIARWPDVKETYPLVVLPHAAGGRKAEGR